MTIEFHGEKYRDDRMFVLYICRCTEEFDDEAVTTTIYHEESPENAKWCLVTYRNNERYTLYRADVFESFEEAELYQQEVEPTIPLISLGGCSMTTPMSHKEFVVWKQNQGMEEYDYREMYQKRWR